MAEVWVTGIGLCSALGLTLQQSWCSLMDGRSGVLLQRPYEALAPVHLALVNRQPTSLDALLDAALSDLLETQADSASVQGVIVGSSRGYQAELEQLSQQRQQEMQLAISDWACIYGKSPAAYVAHELRQRTRSEPVPGPVLSPRAACATGLWAIAQGFELIQTDQCDAVVVGAVESPVTPLTLAGFRRMGALAVDGAYPFDQCRTGFVLGEGAALLRLERQETARRRGARCYGRILGFGITNDACHVNAPSLDQSAAVAAIQLCLARSGLQPHQIDYIHAHGTGTRLNDEAEASLIESLFPHRPAVSSTKGATGHTLGASGALGAAFCLMALTQQQLPPTTGLVTPAYDLNFVKPSLERSKRRLIQVSLQTALCLSFGFGGQNAAVAFAAP